MMKTGAQKKKICVSSGRIVTDCNSGDEEKESDNKDNETES